MRAFLILFLTLTAGPALAHIGHLGEVAGHGHWIALGGIAIAAGIALIGARKDKEPETDIAEEEPENEGEPA